MPEKFENIAKNSQSHIEGELLAPPEARQEPEFSEADEPGLEEELAEKQKMLGKEISTFSDAEKAAMINPSVEKRKVKFTKLNAYILSSLLAFGIASEALTNKAAAGEIKEKKPRLIEKINVGQLERQRMNDYKQLKKIIEEEKIEEKIAALKEEYGQTIDGFLYLNKINRSLEAAKNIDEKDPECFVNKRSPYMMTPGSVLSNVFQEKWRPLTPEQKLEKAKEMAISGFGNVEGLSDAAVGQELKKKYPAVWLSGSVKEIDFVPSIRYQYDEAGKPKSYVFGSTRAFGEEAMMENDTRAVLKIYSEPEQTPKGLLETTDHEIGHKNDWENSRVLSNQQRINFLYDATEVFKDPSHFETPYVASQKNEDKGFENYLKVKEYWAELVKTIFNLKGEEKEVFGRQHPKDIQFFEKWFKIIND